MKTLLIAINAKYIHSNLAVYSLKAFAGQDAPELEIAEYTVNHLREQILADLYKRKPDIAAFSCYLWNIQYVRALIPELRQVLPETRIWAGGPEVSYDAPAFLESLPAAELVMNGEGEETLACLLKTASQGEEGLKQTAGITWRDEKGRIRINPPRDRMRLDAIPFMYRDMAAFENRIVYYESSRGCPFSCSYCMSSIDKQVRFRSLDLVKKELQFFLDCRVPQVKFVDRTFNCSHRHAMEIWTYIRRCDNGYTNFHFEISADLLTEEELALLGQLRPGLVQLEIGVQSTNGRTLAAIRRRADFTKIAARVRQIQEGRNIHQHLDLIAGLPYEGLDSFRRSFNQVYALKPQQLQLGFLKVLKGSLMEKMAGELGIVYRALPPYEVLSTRWLSYGEVLELKSIEEMVEVYYNSSQFSETILYLESLFEDAWSLYGALARFYRERGYEGKSHSRMGRLDILREFALETPGCGREACEDRLICDLYLRENSKSRPGWAAEPLGEKDAAYALYREEAEKRGVPVRRMMHSGHLERMHDGDWIFFDYENREPLSGNARTRRIPALT